MPVQTTGTFAYDGSNLSFEELPNARLVQANSIVAPAPRPGPPRCGQMIDSMARAVAWRRPVDAGRCPEKGDSA
jgi:hypothetical protein